MPTFKLYMIKELADKKGWSIRQLGRKAGLSDSALHEMIKRNAANILNVQKIATALDVDISELVILEDLLMPSDRDRKNVGETIRMMNEISDNLKSSGLMKQNQTKCLIPLLSFDMMQENKLDELINADTTVKSYLVPGVPDADFLLTMPGSSLEGEINAGDVLICKHLPKSKEPLIEYGRAYILETTDGFIIRRLLPHKDKNKLVCTSGNPNYLPFDIGKETILSYSKILGFIRVG